jgi:1,4-dihydroxy-2-naphthoate octaprenyltransferase
MNGSVVDVRGPAPVSEVRAWWMATRPATLTVALSAVAVGGAVALPSSSFRPLAWAAALISATFIQIGTNLANDVYDAEKGADTGERLGPTRVVQAGLIPAKAVKVGMMGAFGLSAVAGAYLAMIGGWPIVLIGVASILSGIAYTGGPWPLGYKGLGDLFVFLFFGPVAVCGTALVCGGTDFVRAGLASLPVGALATAVLVVNNVRDMDTDRIAQKRTLVVRLGRAFGIAEYCALIALSYVVVALMALWWRSPMLLIPLVTVPFAWRLIRTVSARADGPALNDALARTAKLLLAVSLLLAIGIGGAGP